MGGQSSSAQTTTSNTTPWSAALPAMQGLLGNLQGQIGSANLTGTEGVALDNLQKNANAGNPYAGQIGSFATDLLNGGGATAQTGAINQNLTDFQGRMSPYADANYSSLNNPQLQAALQQIRDDTSQQVNGQFAAAGRDLSGANQMALGRGISAAQAPLILDQFNKDQAMRSGSAQSLYDAGNQSSGLLAGLGQQAIANKGAGIGVAQNAMDANNYGASQSLAIEAQRRGIPMQALGLLAQIGVPIAGLGSSSTGTATGKQQMSGADQFGKIAAGANNLLNPLKWLLG